MSSDVVNLVPTNLDFDTKMVLGSRLGNATKNVISTNPSQGAGAIPAGSNLNWSLPISAGHLVESDPEVSCTIVMEATHAGFVDLPTALGLVNDKVGFHSFPINRLVQSATVKANGAVMMSSNCAEDVDAIQYSLSGKELQRISSCAQPDNLFAYDDAASANVLQVVSDSIIQTRGLGASAVTAAHAGTTLTLTFTHSEKLMARPFQWSQPAPHPFVGLHDMNVSLNLVSDFNAACVADSSGYGFAVTSIANWKFKLTQYTPHLNMAQAIPTKSYYNMPVIEHSSAAAVTVAAGASATITTPVRSYPTRPKLYCVYAFSARGDGTTPARTYPITNLSVASGIKKNLLQSYDAQDLYQLSLKNGFNGSAAQFFGGYAGKLATGCMVFFTPSDLDSELYDQSNVQLNHVFNVQATVQNHHTNNQNIILRVTSFTDAVLKYEGGIYSEELASIEPDQLLRAKQMFVDATSAGDNSHVLGGSVWSWITDNVVKPAVRFARNNVGKLETAADDISPVLGDAVHLVSSAVKDGSSLGNKARAAGWGKPAGKGVIHLGGKKLTNRQLLKLLD